MQNILAALLAILLISLLSCSSPGESVSKPGKIIQEPAVEKEIENSPEDTKSLSESFSESFSVALPDDTSDESTTNIQKELSPDETSGIEDKQPEKFPITVGEVIPRPEESPWPSFHGGIRNTGVSSYDTRYINGTIKWRFKTGDGIESSPSIGIDGTVYIGSHDGYFYAINPDGTEKWRFFAGPPNYDERWDVSKSMMASPAIASDGTIYIYSSANYLFAVNPDGTEKWRFYVKWGNDFWSSPVIGHDGTIYTGSARSQEDPNYDGGLHAINPDGSEKWLFLNDCGVTSTAAINTEATIYFGGNVLNPEGEGNIGKLYALNPDGSKKWEYTFENWMESSPSIGPDGTIYTGTGREAKVYAINPDGTNKWHFQAQVGVSACPAIGQDGTIYIGAWDCYFYALDQNGKEKWRYKTPDAFEGVCSSASIGADGTIYVGANSGNFYAFNPDGTVKWSISEIGPVVTSPAIDFDGTVYFGSWDGHLYAIGVSP